ncbi:MAG: glycosyltransferase family 2 protein [PVC group bacterium]
MYREKKISMVIPCHNEEEGIKQLLKMIPEIVDEVVVVDNNCTDNTARAAKAGGARVVAETIPGYGAAHRAGIKAAAGDIIVTMDGDVTYPCESIKRVVDNLISRNLDFISCRRMPDRWRDLNGLLRLIGNIVLTATTKILFFKNILDSQSGMWVFYKKIFPEIEPISDGMGFSEEIKLRAFIRDDIRAAEVPILYFDRVGESALNLWKDGFTNWFFLFQLRFKGIKKWKRKDVAGEGA